MRIIVHQSPPIWWDSLVEKNDGFFTSSSLYADLFKSLNIGQGKFIEISEGKKKLMLVLLIDSLIGGQILLFIPNPFLKLLLKIPFLRSLNMHLQPVILDKKLLKNEKKLEMLSQNFVKFIINLSNKERINILPADFIIFKNSSSSQKIINKNKQVLSQIGTTRLNLEGKNEKDLLYKIFAEPVKRQIRKAQDLNIIIKEDLGPNFFKGLKESFVSNNLAISHIKYYINLKKKYPENIKYLVALYKKKILAGSGFMFYGETILEFSMYTTPYGREHKLPGGDLIKWNILQYGLQNNYKIYDFNMISVDKDLDQKVRNINFYKLKWGGEIIYGFKLEKLNQAMKIFQKIKYLTLGM